MRYRTHHEYELAEAKDERQNDYNIRRDRHLPVILDSDSADVPWRKAKQAEESEVQDEQ